MSSLENSVGAPIEARREKHNIPMIGKIATGAAAVVLFVTGVVFQETSLAYTALGVGAAYMCTDVWLDEHPRNNEVPDANAEQRAA